jgi:RF-1 domain
MSGETKKILSVTLADCYVQHFRSGGPGGQNQNKRDTGTRIRHRASGALGESREHRTQGENIKAAWSRMVRTPAFRLWVALQIAENRTGLTLDEQVAADMAPANLKVEVRDNGLWVTEH